ncbi:MAG: putative rane protein [Firmicutes bacterium]|nr:putative rane protein [Bacillota bacterium]
MKSIDWNEVARSFKNTLSLRRTKITLYMAMVLWVAVATQMIVNRVFQEDIKITEAFVKTNTDEMQSSIEIAAEYSSGDLSAEDKKTLICDLAAKMGLTIDKDISVWEEGDRSEFYYYKRAKKATTEIKVISVGQEEDDLWVMKHYIIVRLSIQEGIAGIDKYKSVLEKAFDKLKVKDMQVTLKYEGNQEGDLTSEQKHEVAQLLVDELQGEIALEYDEGDMYTVYAYTGMLKEYVTSMDNKINIQIAISYNEITNKTRITLATPILSDNW